MSALFGWLVAGAYVGIGCLAALHVGSWVWDRELAAFEPKHRSYPDIYEKPDPAGLVVAVIGSVVGWPLLWPVWRIVSMVMDAGRDPARVHERITDDRRAQR